MSTTTTEAPPAAFDWKRWPEAAAFVDERIALAIEGNALAALLAGRMLRETSTRFADWVDHLVLGDQAGLARSLAGLGFARQPIAAPDGSPAYAHAGGMFPRIVVASGPGPEVREVALKVDSIAAFSRALDLGLKILGPPLGPYRVGRVPGERTSLAVVERRGFVGFDPYSSEMARQGRLTPQGARDAIAARELWEARRRRFDDDAEGFDATEETLARVIELAGSTDLACHLVFEVERDYWQSRNRAARVQKSRQDRLGLGWANHDHHTYRSSRQFFPRLIGMFETLGFDLRERYYTGEHAGWGAQILEHPTTGIVIFADLDLVAEEAGHDFAHDALANLPRPNTVGLWVALHGESILEGGMHHLEAQFDFDALRDDLKIEADVETMKPFSDFSFLRQAFTAGERWVVDPRRLDRALASGLIDEAQHAKFRSEGAIGSHLENLQRRDGYKGFNQKSVSAILAEVDPRFQ
jgi:hypothetical protein